MPSRPALRGAVRQMGALGSACCRGPLAPRRFLRISPPTTAASSRATSRVAPPTRNSAIPATRPLRTVASDSSASPVESPRQALERALLDMRAEANPYMLQTVLNSLRDEPGRERISLAVWGLGAGDDGGPRGNGAAAAKALLRLILADPLSPEQEWERQLLQWDLSQQPLLVRIHGQESPREPVALFGSAMESTPWPELSIPSPSLNGSGLDVFLMASQPGPQAVLLPGTAEGGGHQGAAHRALVVFDADPDSMAATRIQMVPNQGNVAVALNLDSPPEGGARHLLYQVDVESATTALDLFRKDVGNAMQYEALWSKSKLKEARDWLLAGVASNDAGATKLPVRELADSLVRSTSAALSHLSRKHRTATKGANGGAAYLYEALATWAKDAHQELQEQLDAAFTSRRWHKLGWWKLFWRVDDVGMLSAEMISQRFIPAAERGAIYLAGRVEGGFRFAQPGVDRPLRYAPPRASSKNGDVALPTEAAPASMTQWPTHISHTRLYLLQEAVPALQALAQKLVVQTLGTTTLTTSLGVLAYLSSIGAYESGAVAALGTVWALRRMQNKWETAREFWEGETREEGRKAIRAVEASFAGALNEIKQSADEAESRDLEGNARLQDAVARAEDALKRLR